MTTRICVPNIKPAEKEVIKVRVPSATTLYQGSQIVCESLENTTTRSIYAGALVANLTDLPCLVINQGVYEDANGARVEGYVNPGSFSYQAGDVITAIRPQQDLIFTLTADCYTGTAIKDQYLVPAVAGEKLAVAATIGTAKVAYQIEQLITVPVGTTFVAGALVRIVVGR
jgi:hypothetical protein